jgi:23S rRNA A2030 N6-methylase RlmJ
MANTYAANFGDVVKHAVLCESLVREQPERYLESHGGRLDYDLGELEPGPGGVWDFLSRSSDFDTLDSSAYARIIRQVAGEPERPGRYPGSVALADALLPASAEMILFELVEASASDLSDGLAALGRRSRVHVNDGLNGVCEKARPGDLVLLDPFHVHEPRGDLTAVDVFVALASRGVSTILWYAIYEPTEPAVWVTEATRSLDGTAWHARLVGDTTDGGLAGCGFLTAHLSPEAVSAATAIARDLTRALAEVRSGLRLE